MYAFFLIPDPPPPEIYTLSLHDALPICASASAAAVIFRHAAKLRKLRRGRTEHANHETIDFDGELFLCVFGKVRSEEHTSELQSHVNLVCRLLLEKKKKN